MQAYSELEKIFARHFVLNDVSGLLSYKDIFICESVYERNCRFGATARGP